MRNYFLIYNIFVAFLITLKISLNITIRKFVSHLILSIRIRILLDCIICQMDLSVLNICQIPNITWSPNITLLIPISLNFTIHNSYHHVSSDIKLTAIIKQQICNVTLKDDTFRSKGSLWFFGIFFWYACLNPFSNMFNFICALNAIASVRKLARLHDPIVDDFVFLSTLELLNEFFILIIPQSIFYMVS